MRSIRATVLAGAVHLAAIAGVCGAYLLDDELPPLPGSRPIICIIGSQEGLSRLSLLQGDTRANVHLALGVPAGVAAAPDECVRFAYGPRLGLTALFRESTLRHIWITEAASMPDSCPGVRMRTVPIEARSWYPQEYRVPDRHGCDVFEGAGADRCEGGD